MPVLHELSRGRLLAAIVASLAVTVLVVSASLWVGTQSSHVRQAMSVLLGTTDDEGAQMAYHLVFKLRLPRTLLALLVGTTLAMAGTTFQALLRNPLAEPYTLGVASGGALGALLALKLAPGSGALWAGYLPVAKELWAFAGSTIVVLIVYGLSRSAGILNTYDLLLAGVTMGIFCGAAMLAVQYFADHRELFDMIRWMMGELETIGYGDVLLALAFVVPAWIAFLALANPLNQLSLGEDLAGARGVRVSTVQVVGFFAGSLGTAAVVAVCGPIGFVGLIVPHAVRAIVGPDHRILMPCVGLIGGAFLVVCDWGSRMILPIYGELRGLDLEGVQLPIGVITSLLGGPFFLALLLRSRFSQRVTR